MAPTQPGAVTFIVIAIINISRESRKYEDPVLVPLRDRYPNGSPSWQPITVASHWHLTETLMGISKPLSLLTRTVIDCRRNEAQGGVQWQQRCSLMSVKIGSLRMKELWSETGARRRRVHQPDYSISVCWLTPPVGSLCVHVPLKGGAIVFVVPLVPLFWVMWDVLAQPAQRGRTGSSLLTGCVSSSSIKNHSSFVMVRHIDSKFRWERHGFKSS